MLYEALRNYFSLNTAGEISILFKYCSALLFPLQGPFDAYDLVRRAYEIVANCKFQIGQLTNVLNYFYDPLLKRIFIAQATIVVLSAPEFEYTTDVQCMEFEEPATAQAREFGDKTAGQLVSINIPIGIDLAAITATIEQIKVDGIDYQIIEF